MTEESGSARGARDAPPEGFALKTLKTRTLQQPVAALFKVHYKVDPWEVPPHARESLRASRALRAAGAHSCTAHLVDMVQRVERGGRNECPAGRGDDVTPHDARHAVRRTHALKTTQSWIRLRAQPCMQLCPESACMMGWGTLMHGAAALAG